jgi:hypothetical protein
VILIVPSNAIDSISIAANPDRAAQIKYLKTFQLNCTLLAAFEDKSVLSQQAAAQLSRPQQVLGFLYEAVFFLIVSQMWFNSF